VSFYNTNKESSQESLESSRKAKRQEIVIYDLFLLFNEPLSPSMVYKALNEKWPITSIRRAMTNLTDDGVIVKTQETVKGVYGKNEHLWSLPEKVADSKQALLFDF
tara:strand:- start:117 stop:434 length:318 start_codon:yes stop_codon:yes gene_type:complete